jgi:hypothetical protein
MVRPGSILAGADDGLLVAPPPEVGLSAVTLEQSRMVVIMAVGHRLARYDELTVDVSAPDRHAESHPRCGEPAMSDRAT